MKMVKGLLYAIVTLVNIGCIIGCGEEENLPAPETPDNALTETYHGNINLPEYFPLKTGNSWEYEIFADGAPIGNRKLELGEKEKVYHAAFHTAFPANKVSAYPPDADIYQPFFVCHVTLTDLGRFFEWYVASGNRILFCGTVSSAPWGEDVKFGSLVFLETEMIISNEIITVTAGTFTCVKIERNNSCNIDVLPLDPTLYAPTDSAPVYEWYSKGVGMIKREYKLGKAVSEVLVKYKLK